MQRKVVPDPARLLDLISSVLASISRDALICVWSVDNGALLQRIESEKTMFDCLFVPDSRRLLTGCDTRSLILWDFHS